MAFTGNFNSGAFNLGSAAGRFTPGGALDNFQTGIDAGGGFGQTNSGGGGFLSGLAGKFTGLLGGGQGDNAFGQALGLGVTAGNLATQAANIQGQAADVAAINARNNMLTDFNLERLAYGDKQKLDTNRFARQKMIMAAAPSLMSNAIYSSGGNPNAGPYALSSYMGAMG